MVEEADTPDTEEELREKIEEGLKGASGIILTQRIYVEGNTKGVMKSFQEAVLRGARLNETRLPQINGALKRIEMELELDLIEEEWGTDLVEKIYATPIPATDAIFCKPIMEGLSWEAFKTVCGKWGITGRSRGKMLTEYLAKTKA